MLSVVKLSVVMLSVIMLSVIMLSVIMLSVIMLNVIMLSVVAPLKQSVLQFIPKISKDSRQFELFVVKDRFTIVKKKNR